MPSPQRDVQKGWERWATSQEAGLGDEVVAVTQATDGDQVPWTLDGIQRNHRIMFGGGKAPAHASAPRSASRLDAADREWRSVRNTRNRADLIAFAKRYPGTAFAELALLKAGQLGGGAAGTGAVR